MPCTANNARDRDVSQVPRSAYRDLGSERALTLKHNGGVRADEQCAGACAADWARATLCVDGDVAGKHDGVATVPLRE